MSEDLISFGTSSCMIFNSHILIIMPLNLKPEMVNINLMSVGGIDVEYIAIITENLVEVLVLVVKMLLGADTHMLER